MLPDFLPELAGSPGAPVPAAPHAGTPGAETFVVHQRVGPDVRDLYDEAHRKLDRLLLPLVLKRVGGSQHQAALILGIARQTLRLKLRQLGLQPGQPPGGDDAPEAEGDG